MTPHLAQRLLEAAPVAIYLYDARSQTSVLLTPGSLRMLGYTRERLTSGERLQVHPDDRPAIDRQLRRLGDRGDELQSCEYRLQAADGSWHWFRSDEIVFTRSGDGQLETIVGIATDIGAHRQMGEERDRLVSVIEAASDFIGVARPDGTLLYLNPAGRRLTGIGQDEDPSSLRIADFHGETETEHVFATVFPAAARGEPVHTRGMLRHRDGRSIPVSIVVSAHRGRNGRVAYFAAIMRDLSGEVDPGARRQLDRLAAAARRLETLSHALEKRASSALAKEPA